MNGQSANAASGFFVTGGTLRLDAPCYVERQADRELLDGLLRGEFCYVLTSRQMGKSSLMVRAAAKLREQGAHVIALDLAGIGQNLSAEQWYTGLLAGIGRQLRLEDELEEFWERHARLSPVQRLFSALRDVALVRREGKLVVFVDELDVVRSLPFRTDEFFAAIRSCYNRRAEDREFERLTFCLLGVAMPTDLIQDTRITPFNIGRRIELHDFTEAEAAPLAQGLEAAAGQRQNAILALQRILHWTNGHPYLTQRLCHAVAAARAQAGAALRASSSVPAFIDELCEELFLTSRAREQDDNLLFVRERLLRSETDLAGLLELYEQVRRGRRPVPDAATDPRVSILRLSGIVRAERGELKIRNRVYRAVFDGGWVETNMPDAERRRQREAYRRGIVRATSIAAAIVLAMAALAFYAQHQASEAKRTRQSLSAVTVKALLSQARLGRASGQAGRRFDGLEAIKLAAGIRPGRAVRDEAIACLALLDLRLVTNGTVRVGDGAPVAFNRDFTRIASGDGRGEIVIRSVNDGTLTARLAGFGRPATRLRFSPDETHLAASYAGSDANVLALWKVDEQRAVLWLTNAAVEPVLEFNTGNRRAAYAEPDRVGAVIRVFDLDSGASKTVSSVEGMPRRMRCSPQGNRLALAREDSLKIEVRTVSDGAVLKTLIPPDVTEALAWSADGAWLAAGCRDGGIYVWDLETGQRRDMRGHQGAVTSLAYAHAGNLLASGGTDHTVRLWETHREGRPAVTFEGADGLQALHFSEDDRRLGCRVANGQAQFFEVAQGVEWKNLHDERATAIAEIDVSSDGRWLACAAENGVTLWGLDSGRRHCVLDLGRAESVAFHPLTGALVASDFKGVQAMPVRPLEPGGGICIGPAAGLKLPEDAGRLAFAADGRTLAVVSSNRILLLDGLSHAPKSELRGSAGCSTVGLSSNALWVAAANWATGEVWVWDTTTSNRVAALAVGGPAQVAFSPAGSWLATATAREGRLWRTGSWQAGLVAARNPAGSQPASTTFSRNGAIWALGGADGTVELYDPASGAALAKLEGPHSETLVWLRFTPDGTRLVAAEEDRSIQVWDLAALRRGLAGLGLDWAAPPLPARAVEKELLVVSNAVGWFVNRPQLSEAVRRQRVVMASGEIERLGVTADRLRRRAAERNALGLHAEAIADWQEGLRLAPTNTSLLRELAWFYLTGPTAFRDYAAAQTLAAQAVALEPNRAENELRLGLAHFHTADYTNALTHLQRATALRKDWRASFSRFYEAICHARLGHAEDAVAAYAKAAEGATREADSATERAQWAAAREEARRALEELR